MDDSAVVNSPVPVYSADPATAEGESLKACRFLRLVSVAKIFNLNSIYEICLQPRIQKSDDKESDIHSFPTQKKLSIFIIQFMF